MCDNGQVNARIRSLVAALLLPAIAACGDLGGPRPYSYTLKGLCEPTPRQSFPASPPSGRVTVTQSTTVNLSPRIPSVEGETVEVFLESITLTAAQGITSFEFMEAITVRARTPGTGALVTLASYAAVAGRPAPSPLALTVQATQDLAPLLNNKVLAVEYELTMTPPQVSWALDVEGCFTIRASGTRRLFEAEE